MKRNRRELCDEECRYQAENFLNMPSRISFDTWARSKDFWAGDRERIKEFVKGIEKTKKEDL